MFRLILLSFFLLLVVSSVNAQDTLHISANSYEEGIYLKWQPTNPALWVETLSKGFSINRQELDENENPLSGTQTVVATTVLPKDTIWFEQNKRNVDGMMEVVGALLYDTTFQFKDKSILDANEMRWNYLFHETQYSPEIAFAIGAAFLDSTAIAEKKYLYEISSNKSGLIGDKISIQHSTGTRIENYNTIFNYVFPNDKSLSDMSPERMNTVFPQVIGIAKSFGDSIVLRWGPNTPELWRAGNKDGYLVQRMEVGKTDVTSINIMPWTREQITPAIEADSFAMLAASNLLGTGQPGATDFYEKAAYEENRFGFSLYAAERSGVAADILGLRYVDKDIEPDKTYLYTVSTKSASHPFSKAIVEIKNELIPLPTPYGLELIAGEKSISLKWEKESNISVFNSYYVERSDDDGRNWQLLTQQPLIFIETGQVPIDFFSYIDSVGVNYKKFRYRLKGVNSFGQISEGTEIAGQAVDLTPPPTPRITEGMHFEEDKKMLIRWEIGGLPEDFKDFKILLGEDSEGVFDTLSANIKGNIREYTWNYDAVSDSRAYYFRVIAADKADNFGISHPKYIHVPDRTPPPPPTLVEGTIDEEGEVSLLWKHSVAEDVTGYVVYVADYETDDYFILNDNRIYENYYSYEIPVKSLNKDVFYRIAAEDESGNLSNPSQPVKLKRPDKVPPIPPQIIQPKSTMEGVLLTWKPSPSKDVVNHLMYRRLYGTSNEWVTIDSIAPNQSKPELLDREVLLNVQYEYCISAIDDAGNESEKTIALNGKKLFNPEEVKISELTTQLEKKGNNITLNWIFKPDEKILPPGQEMEFYILRSTGSSNLEFYKKQKMGNNSFIDEDVISGVLYNYAVQVRFSNGWKGTKSEEKAVILR